MTDKAIIPIDPLRPYMFFRRGEERHIMALYEKGEIYINTVNYFRKCEGIDGRADPQDSVSGRRFVGDVKIQIAEVGKDFDKNSLRLDASDFVEFYDYNHTGNIYCLSAVYGYHLLERKDVVFDTRRLGSYAIAIAPQQFIRRLLKGLAKAGYSGIRHGPVKYYAHTFSGETGVFGKHQSYHNQCEYRFFIPRQSDDPISIQLGSLADIAYVGDSLQSRMTFTDNHQQHFTL